MCHASFDAQNPLFPPISILASVRAWIVVWCRRKFKIKMEIENIDFFNVDANWDPDIDDITLSQICTYIEKEHEAFERKEDLSLSQGLDKYEVDMEMDSAEFQQLVFN